MRWEDEVRGTDRLIRRALIFFSLYISKLSTVGEEILSVQMDYCLILKAICGRCKYDSHKWRRDFHINCEYSHIITTFFC